MTEPVSGTPYVHVVDAPPRLRGDNALAFIGGALLTTALIGWPALVSILSPDPPIRFARDTPTPTEVVRIYEGGDVRWSQPLPAFDGGRELTKAITLVANTTTTVRYSSTVAHREWQCVNNSTSQVFTVDSDATATTNGGGPFCTDTAACQSAIFGSSTAAASVRTTGTPTLRCRFIIP